MELDRYVALICPWK